MSTLEELKKEENIVYLNIKKILKQLQTAREIYIAYRDTYNKQKEEYKKLEIRIAEIEGKCKKIEVKKRKEIKKALKLNLSREEILSLAKMLGIEDKVKCLKK